MSATELSEHVEQLREQAEEKSTREFKSTMNFLPSREARIRKSKAGATKKQFAAHAKTHFDWARESEVGHLAEKTHARAPHPSIRHQAAGL